MGHEVIYRDFAVTTKKKDIENELNDYVHHVTWQEGGGGLARPIRWYDNSICDDYESASEFLHDEDKGWYDQLAVKYRETVAKHSFKYEEIDKKANELYSKLWKEKNEVYARSRKSEFMGCDNCGSKLRTSLVKSNRCPMCGHDFRPKSTLERLDKMEAKLVKLREDARQIAIKESKNAEVRWLVKIEYHI